METPLDGDLGVIRAVATAARRGHHPRRPSNPPVRPAGRGWRPQRGNCGPRGRAGGCRAAAVGDPQASRSARWRSTPRPLRGQWGGGEAAGGTRAGALSKPGSLDVTRWRSSAGAYTVSGGLLGFLGGLQRPREKQHEGGQLRRHVDVPGAQGRGPGPQVTRGDAAPAGQRVRPPRGASRVAKAPRGGPFGVP